MTLTWSRRAQTDLRKIYQRIRRDSPRSAIRVLERLEVAPELLLQFPNAGRAGVVEGTRELVTTPLPYILVYEVRASEVFILQVRHGAELWPPLA